MKNLSICIVISLFLAGFLFPAGITVNSPKKGESIKAGTSYDIIWVGKKTSVPVKINIFKNRVDKSNFVLQLNGPNTGKLKWDIPSNFNPGNYQIRIKTTDNKYFGDSEKFFIAENKTNPTNKNKLQLLNPNGVSQPVLKPEFQINRNYKINANPILMFKCSPPTQEPGRFAYLLYKYTNAKSAKIINLNTGKLVKILPASTKTFEGAMDISPKESTKYKLIVKNDFGEFSKTTSLTFVRSRRGIEGFGPTKQYMKPGDSFSFLSVIWDVDNGVISEKSTGNIINKFVTNGKYRFDYDFDMIFRHPDEYTLTVYKNGQKVQEKKCKVFVNKSLRAKQGINRAKLIANWRFAEMHVDLFIDVFGAKSVSLYERNKFTNKVLRVYHVNLGDYKQFKKEAKPFRKYPSKDFAKTYFFWFEVKFWNDSEKVIPTSF